MSRKFLSFLLISLCYCQQFDDRCIVPNTMPSQNLPHQMSSSLFYKCHNGLLLLLTCPRGMKFDPFLSACLPDDLRDCSLQNIGMNLIKNPTPPYITTTSVKFSDTNPIIPSTIPNPPILTSTQSSLPADDKAAVDSTMKIEISTPTLFTTILSTLVPEKAPVVTATSFHDELPISTSTLRIPTPPLLTTSTSLTEISTLVTTTTELSTTNADIVSTTSIPTAPTIFETTPKLFSPSLPAIEQLNNAEEERVDFR